MGRPSPVLKLAAKHAGYVRRGMLDEAHQTRCAMVAAGVEESIRTALSSPSPPTDEQRQRLAALLLATTGAESSTG